jgi:hypothetical protein
MGNYVIGVGNYVIVSPSQLGNYKIADTALGLGCDHEGGPPWMVTVDIAGKLSWRARACSGGRVVAHT